jgi:hypothetical protein
LLGAALALAPVVLDARGSTTLSAAEARDHVGEHAKVCGQVASTRYAEDRNGAPTFLNLDPPYPRQIFTALVWGEDRMKRIHSKPSHIRRESERPDS